MLLSDDRRDSPEGERRSSRARAPECSAHARDGGALGFCGSGAAGAAHPNRMMTLQRPGLSICLRYGGVPQTSMD